MTARAGRPRQGERRGAGRDPARPITEADIDAAKESLIRRQDTHLDSLAERLREPRVRRIIAPILAGEALPAVPEDDLRHVQDLGLVRAEDSGGLVIANPIYREVITSPGGRRITVIRA